MIQKMRCRAWLFPLGRQVYRVYDSATLELLGHFLGAILLCAISVGQAPLITIVMWGAAQGLVLGLRFMGLQSYREAQQHLHLRQVETQLCPYRWGFSYLVGVFLSGLTWGASVFLLNFSDEPAYHAVLVSGIFVLAGSAVVTLGSIFSLYLLFVLPMVLPVAVWLLLNSDPLYNAMALAALIYVFYTFMAAHSLSSSVQTLHDKNQEILATQREILLRLGRAGEYRDSETGEHIQRMSKSCQLLALQAGLGQTFADKMLYASPMHDVGKIGIADHILLKPGKLSEAERAVMQTHVLIGKNILDGHSCEIMQMASRIAETHHERWDGMGYPYGLAGTEIPLEGRITAICDVFDALTSQRPYKSAWSDARAVAFIREEAGRHFDPVLVGYFLEIIPAIVALRDTCSQERDNLGYGNLTTVHPPGLIVPSDNKIFSTADVCA